MSAVEQIAICYLYSMVLVAARNKVIQSTIKHVTNTNGVNYQFTAIVMSAKVVGARNDIPTLTPHVTGVKYTA